ncbi:MAG: alpha/beta hydrolase [Acidimicrobiia bacterium]
MPLDPQVVALMDGFLAQMPRAADVGVDVAREHLERLAADGAPYMDPIHESYDIEIPRAGGSVTARVLRPSAARNLPVLVWFHGGGFCTGSHRTHDGVLRPVANQVGCVVVIPDYRLAPEHPYPAAFDDCVATLEWVAAHGDELGGDASRIAIGGDSAGGNLAAGLALEARDRNVPVCAQVLVYPSVDDDPTRPSLAENAQGYMLETSDIADYLDWYVPDLPDRADWRVFPMKAESLAGTPPALVLTAEFDPLRDEGEAYGHRLQHEGVPTVVVRYDGLVHGFFGMWMLIDAARQSLVDTVEFLHSRFGEEF